MTTAWDCLAEIKRLAGALDERASHDAYRRIEDIANRGLAAEPAPIPMFLTCPMCGARHIDDGEFATRPHHTHACQECGLTWRPAAVPTVGVWFLPGFKNAPAGADTTQPIE